MKIVLLLPIVFIFSIASLLACARWEFDVPTCAYFTRADAVFMGKVIKIEKLSMNEEYEDGSRKVYFKVRENFKGAENSTFALITSDWRAACGLEVKKGQTWIVYANYQEADKSFHSFRGYRYNINDSKEDLEILKNASQGLIETSLFGRLVSYGTASEYIYDSVVVSISDRDFEREVKTDDKGAFKFESLPQGNYKIRLNFPYRASVLWLGYELKHSFIQESPTIFQYQIQLNKGECNYNQFEVFKYSKLKYQLKQWREELSPLYSSLKILLTVPSFL